MEFVLINLVYALWYIREYKRNWTFFTNLVPLKKSLPYMLLGFTINKSSIYLSTEYSKFNIYIYIFIASLQYRKSKKYWKKKEEYEKKKRKKQKHR